MAQTVGFFTDTTLCIGCKACEVACKEWNQLPNNPLEFRDSYDNTGQLDHANWRHVRFLEQTTSNPDKPIAWSMMSDRSEEHTSELQSQFHLVCRLLLE